jgi:5-hydroxyisourate hydrolase-like protein (transthyretin family)
MARIPHALSLVVAMSSAVTSQERPPAPLASAIIAGKVVTADTGAPIRGAQVRLRSSRGGNDVRLVTTDDQGNFEARNLFAGDWQITASKSGFTTARYGQRRATDEGRPVSVSNGQRAVVQIGLPRAGAITGRLLDEFGEPLLGARIQATRPRIVRGVRQLVAVGASDTTDDTGSFRLFGLAPGTYYVTATLRASAPDADLLQATVGGVTYYPGTSDVAEALPLVLRPGDETNVAFQLAPVRDVRVSGTVLGANGAPAADVEVRLLRMDATEVGTTVGNFGRTAGDGTFTVINVPPGQYVITAVHVEVPRDRQTSPIDTFEETTQALSVGFDDVSGVTLAMHNGVRVSGIIEAEPGVTLPSPLTIEVTATPAFATGRGPAIMQVTRSTNQRATFQLMGMFGPVYFGARLPAGLMLKSIELNGTDVTDKAADLRGPNPLEVRFVLTNRVTELSGVATIGGTPASNVSVVVFPDDERKWTFPSRYVAFVDTGDDGRFTLRQLPPDERYFAAIVSSLEDGDQFDPELLRTLRDRATSFTLREGEHKTLTVGR